MDQSQAVPTTNVFYGVKTKGAISPEDIDTVVNAFTSQLTALTIASGFARTVTTSDTPHSKPSNRQKHTKFSWFDNDCKVMNKTVNSALSAWKRNHQD